MSGFFARDAVTRSLDVTTTLDFQFGIATARRALGRVELSCGNHTQAARELTAALEMFLSIDATFESARTRLYLAEC